ncbi:DUF3857 domain-containing protein [bacterium]|nr:DUF3857 domain-containing protein [bacterium]
MKSNKYYWPGILAILLTGVLINLMVTAAAFSQPTDLSPKFQELIQNAPSGSDYPDADVVILYTELKYTLLPDGHYSKNFHYLIKSFNYMGKKEYGNFKIQFDAEYEEVEIETARTFNGLDKVDNVDQNSINIIDPPGLERASIYSNVKQKVISFPSMQDTSVIELRGELRTIKQPEEPYFSNKILLLDTNPILEKIIIVEVPENTVLKHYCGNGAPQPAVSGKSYRWEVKDHPGIIMESGTPPYSEFLPVVYYSTAPDWDFVGSFLRDKFKSPVEPDDKISAKVASIITSDDKVDQLWEIFYYVADKVRNVHLPLGIAGYQPNPASLVLSNSYADTRDKCVLLISMLQSNGISAFPALVNDAGNHIRKDIPFLDQFNKMLVVAQCEGQKIWLDPFTDDALFGYIPDCLGEEALVIYNDRAVFETVQGPPHIKDLVSSQYDLELNPEGGLKGNLTVSMNGYFDQRFRSNLKDARPKQVEMELEKSASSVASGAQLTDYDLSDLNDLTKPSSLSLGFEAEKYASIQQNMLIFYIPTQSLDFTGIELPIFSETREFPILLTTTLERQNRYTITIPEGYEIEYIPESKTIKNEVGSFEINSDQRGQEISYNYHLKVDHKRIDPEQYSEFKALVKNLLSPKNRLVLLEAVDQK